MAAMVNRRKAMQIRYKHIDLELTERVFAISIIGKIPPKDYALNRYLPVDQLIITGFVIYLYYTLLLTMRSYRFQDIRLIFAGCCILSTTISPDGWQHQPVHQASCHSLLTGRHVVLPDIT